MFGFRRLSFIKYGSPTGDTFMIFWLLIFDFFVVGSLEYICICRTHSTYLLAGS